MDRIERIAHMEELLDEASEALKTLDGALAAYEEALGAIDELSEYYTSDEWMADFEADEAGELPADLKRGVLSEDAVYDTLTLQHDLVASMNAMVAAYLERM